MHLFEQLNKVGTTIVLATHNKSLVSDFPYRRLHLSNGTLNVFTKSAPPTESTTQLKGLI